MKLSVTAIPGLVVVEPAVFSDERGWFMESFHQRKFADGLAALGLPPPRPFVQDNHSCSNKGVLRGLHYQVRPHPQGKLVRVVRGAAFDVAVDIRSGSATFGHHVAIELSAANRRMLWIPEGFAHGFQALEDDTHFLYKTTDFYAPDCERSIRWDDPRLAIPWPLREPLLINDKDREAPGLAAVEAHPGAVAP